MSQETPKLTPLQYAIREIYSTEESYIKQITLLIDFFYSMEDSGDILTDQERAQQDAFLMPYATIIENNRQLLEKANSTAPVSDTEKALKFMADSAQAKGSPYLIGMMQYDKFMAFITNLQKKDKFVQFRDGAEGRKLLKGQTLDSLAITLIQRPMRFNLLTQEILKKTTPDSLSKDAEERVKSIAEVAAASNTAIKLEDHSDWSRVNEALGGSKETPQDHALSVIKQLLWLKIDDIISKSTTTEKIAELTDNADPEAHQNLVKYINSLGEAQKQILESKHIRDIYNLLLRGMITYSSAEQRNTFIDLRFYLERLHARAGTLGVPYEGAMSLTAKASEKSILTSSIDRAKFGEEKFDILTTGLDEAEFDKEIDPLSKKITEPVQEKTELAALTSNNLGLTDENKKFIQNQSAKIAKLIYDDFTAYTMDKINAGDEKDANAALGSRDEILVAYSQAHVRLEQAINEQSLEKMRSAKKLFSELRTQAGRVKKSNTSSVRALFSKVIFGVSNPFERIIMEVDALDTRLNQLLTQTEKSNVVEAEAPAKAVLVQAQALVSQSSAPVPSKVTELGRRGSRAKVISKLDANNHQPPVVKKEEPSVSQMAPSSNVAVSPQANLQLPVTEEVVVLGDGGKSKTNIEIAENVAALARSSGAVSAKVFEQHAEVIGELQKGSQTLAVNTSSVTLPSSASVTAPSQTNSLQPPAPVIKQPVVAAKSLINEPKAHQPSRSDNDDKAAKTTHTSRWQQVMQQIRSKNSAAPVASKEAAKTKKVEEPKNNQTTAPNFLASLMIAHVVASSMAAAYVATAATLSALASLGRNTSKSRSSTYAEMDSYYSSSAFFPPSRDMEQESVVAAPSVTVSVH